MVNNHWNHISQAAGWLNRIALKGVQSLGIRPLCLICSQPADSAKKLCAFCEKHIRYQYVRHHHYCVRCAIPLQNFDLSATTTDPEFTVFAPILCGSCIQRPPHYNRCISALYYEPLSAKLISQFKHHGDLGSGAELTRHMIDAIKWQYGEQQPPIDLIVPVPIHTNKLYKRGFNQAGEMAKIVARNFEIPVLLNGCVRLSDDAAQQTLGRKDRIRNVKHSFAVPTNHHSSIAGKRIAIVDDVVTTGSTSNALAQCLLAAGGLSCDVWCFARTPINT